MEKTSAKIAEDITKAWLHAHARKGHGTELSRCGWSTGGYMTP